MDPRTRAPQHLARPTLLTRHRERVEEATHHAWSAAGMDKPWDHKGRHVDTTAVTQPLWMAS